MLRRLDLSEILQLVQMRPEQIVFDAKRDFTAPRDGETRAEFVKDVVAIANGTAFTRGPGFIVYGVDGQRADPIVGVSTQYDDASLQQLVSSHVEPAIEFVFYDDVDAGAGRRIAVLHIAPSKQPFHVVVKDVGSLRDGTSFIRQGSSTRGLRRQDWMRLCFGRDSQYLAQALQQYGATAQLVQASAAHINALGTAQQQLLRQMESASGLPHGTLG